MSSELTSYGRLILLWLCLARLSAVLLLELQTKETSAHSICVFKLRRTRYHLVLRRDLYALACWLAETQLVPAVQVSKIAERSRGDGAVSVNVSSGVDFCLYLEIAVDHAQ